MASQPHNPVESHYASRSLVDVVLAALDAAGLPPRLTAADLAPLDQFHARGLEATKELAVFAASMQRAAFSMSAPALADRRATWRRAWAARSSGSISRWSTAGWPKR